MKQSRLFLILFSTVAFVGAQSNLYGQTIHDPNRLLNLYYTITNAGSGSGANDLAIGNGGTYGTDLYAADFGTYGANNGRIWRIADSDNDGVGEGSVFSSAASNAYKSPISVTFGQGGSSPLGIDLYTMDYNNSTSLRHVYRVNGSGGATQLSTTATFNPDGIEAHPDGQRMLINDAGNFTNFGGGDDGTIFQVNSLGTRTVWADGSNNPNGLWDINSEGVFSPDGWYTLDNHHITGSFLSEFVQFKDLNLDGDANDAGESRVLIGLGAPVSGGGVFDNLGNFYNGLGNDLYRFTDLNNDGDFWDFTGGTFDAGERFLFGEDLGTLIHSLEYDPNSDVFFVGTDGGGGTTRIYRIYAVPEPSGALIGAISLLSISFFRRRQGSRAMVR